MSSVKRLIREVHQRSLWQVLAIYMVGSWIGYEVILALTEGLGLPGWVPPFAIVLFIIGLPIVLATAFVQEGAPAVRFGDDPLLADLDAIEDDGALAASRPVEHDQRRAASSPPVGSRGVLGYFTWRRAVTGGVLAFAGLGLVTSGFMGMRTLGIGPAATLMTSGVLDERGRAVLAEFGNATTDDLLGDVVTEALRIQLTQSQVLRLADAAYVGRVLQRMERDTDAELDLELAREVAIREGLEAVITGEIGAAGGGYLLSARIIAPSSGEVLAAFGETARDSTQLIDAVDRLGRSLREKVGESLRTIRADEPLERVTTPSLAALRRYTQAIRAYDAGEPLRSVSLLEDAIALDGTFAMAYRKLGAYLSNQGLDREKQVQAFTRAYELRDRLNERERYQAIASYHADVRGDGRQAIQAYRNLLDIDPENTAALNNLGREYNFAGDVARAAELFARAARTEAVPTPYMNLLGTLASQGKFDSLEVVLDTVLELFPDNPGLDGERPWLLWIRGEVDAAIEARRSSLNRYGDNPLLREEALGDLARLAESQGRLADAERYRREAMRSARSAGRPAGAVFAAIAIADMSMWLREDPDRAVRELERSLAEHPLEAMPAADRPYLRLAGFYGYTGRPDRARSHLADFERHNPPDQRGRVQDFVHVVRAVIAAGEHQYDEALTLLEAAVEARGALRRVMLDDRAAWLEGTGRHEEALAAYDEYLSQRNRWAHRLVDYPYTLLRAAALHEERGDAARAAEYYGRLVEVWKDADPELQPRVREAQRRLAQLAREGR